jgi:acetyl-CoA carboxylase biotin carboxyl carrier protein
MDLKDIKAIIDLMKKHSISDFEMEKEGFKIKLKRTGSGNGGEDYPMAYVPPALPMPASALPASAPTAASAPVRPAATSTDMEIKSPMIGTFYRSPSPDSAPYVEVGAEVGPDTVVCIIEAMKVMNEIKAETRGVITEVLAENSKPVEFGQPLYKVRPV